MSNNNNHSASSGVPSDPSSLVRPPPVFKKDHIAPGLQRQHFPSEPNFGKSNGFTPQGPPNNNVPRVNALTSPPPLPPNFSNGPLKMNQQTSTSSIPYSATPPPIVSTHSPPLLPPPHLPPTTSPPISSIPLNRPPSTGRLERLEGQPQPPIQYPAPPPSTPSQYQPPTSQHRYPHHPPPVLPPNGPNTPASSQYQPPAGPPGYPPMPAPPTSMPTSHPPGFPPMPPPTSMMNSMSLSTPQPTPNGFPPRPQPSSVPSQQSYPPPPATGHQPSYPPPPTSAPQPTISHLPPPAQPPHPTAPLGFQNPGPPSNGPINLLEHGSCAPIPPAGIKSMRPNLPTDHRRMNAAADTLRCTLSTIPASKSLLEKSRLPLGIVIHPFRDTKITTIAPENIVRCRGCRTYINPFVSLTNSQRSWRCNICLRSNEIPADFCYDNSSRSYVDPRTRPELRHASIEFIANTDYSLRPPQPATYVFVLDVSVSARKSGYLRVFCETLSNCLEELPGDSRRQFCLMAFDSNVHFFPMDPRQTKPGHMVVTDVDDTSALDSRDGTKGVFLPSPDGLLVNLEESMHLIQQLLHILPNLFACETEDLTSETCAASSNSCLGPALQAAYKLACPIGGRVSVFLGSLANVGVGQLDSVASRASSFVSTNDALAKVTKKAGHSVLNPGTDFYKNLGLEASQQQVAFDLFCVAAQYVDVASIAPMCQFSAGQVFHYPNLRANQNIVMAEKMRNDLHRYFSRRIGFEAVMRIRCTNGLSIVNFHGSCFMRSTDLVALPNCNPDAGYAVQYTIEENLPDPQGTASFQAALLYTSSSGERCIRVHTLCLPVSNQLTEIFYRSDQQAMAGLVSKMAVERSLSSCISDAREAFIMVLTDAITQYATTLGTGQKINALPVPAALQFLPMLIQSLLKHVAFRLPSGSTTQDRGVAIDSLSASLEEMRSSPVSYLLQRVCPTLYPLQQFFGESRSGEEQAIDPLAQSTSDAAFLKPSQLPLSYQSMPGGLYLLDAFDIHFLLLSSSCPNAIVEAVFGVPSQAELESGVLFCDVPLTASTSAASNSAAGDQPDGSAQSSVRVPALPDLDNPMSHNVRELIEYINDSRPIDAIPMLVKLSDNLSSNTRESDMARVVLTTHLVQDRTPHGPSYSEFIQSLKSEVKLT